MMLVVLSLQANGIEKFAKKISYETIYEKALTKAKKENKMLMIAMVTHYCPWCRKLERTTLSKKSVQSKVQKYFIPLIVNREAHKFPKKFYTPIIPVVFFIDPKNENIIWESIGYKKRSDFLLQIEEALKLYAKQ